MSAARRLRPVPRTIRGRLLTGIILLVAAGLAGCDLAAYALLRSYYADRTERRLTGTAERIDELLSRRHNAQAVENAVRVLGQGRVEAVLVDGAERVITSRPAEDPRRDALIGALTVRTVARLARGPGRDVRLEVAGDPYRAVYHRLDGAALGTETGTPAPLAGVVIAVSVRDDEDALRRLAVNQVIVTSVALLALGGVAFGVLRVGLRPLGDMAATAAAIAAGDRTRHIPITDPRTEAGRLAVTLNQAFERQREAEDRLRRFVADVSHELRTPLSTIGGWADLYFQGALPGGDAAATAMGRIADQAAGMRRLVEDLLLLARLDRQRPLERAPVELAALAGEIVSDARVIAPDRRVTFSAARGDAVTVIGDAERLRRLLRNLLGNALQHTPPGTPVHVTVRGGPGDEAASGVRLTVADEGPGIPPEMRAQLFERFYQGDPVRRHGSGLGLAIARAIAEAHGGTIEVGTPADGSGSEFTVILPAARTAAHGPAAARPRHFSPSPRSG